MKVMQRIPCLCIHERSIGAIVFSFLIPLLFSLCGKFSPALEVTSECLLTSLGLGTSSASAVLGIIGTRWTLFCSMARFTTVKA